MREPSRLRKAEEIIELAMMFQNSFRGLCIDDIEEHFECSRRSAERMKTLLFEMVPPLMLKLKPSAPELANKTPPPK